MIRMSRIGKKHAPMYRLTIAEKAKDPYGRALEILGSYNPTSKELVAKADRIQYWLSQGSGISPTVNNLLIDKGIIKGEKVKASKPGKKVATPETKAEAKPAVAAVEKTSVETPAVEEVKTEETPAEEIKIEETPVVEAVKVEAETVTEAKNE